LVELLLVGAIGAFHVPVEFRGARRQFGGAIGPAPRSFGAGVVPDDGGRQQGAIGPSGFGGAATSGPNAVMSAVQSTCAAVTDAPAQYEGVLYDCAGAGSALRALGGD
jgi:hypothetical protein